MTFLVEHGITEVNNDDIISPNKSFQIFWLYKMSHFIDHICFLEIFKLLNFGATRCKTNAAPIPEILLSDDNYQILIEVFFSD